MRSRTGAVVVLLALGARTVAQDPPATGEPGTRGAAAAPTVDAKAVRNLPSAVTSLAVSPDGRWIAAGGHDGSVVLFASSSGERRAAGKVDGAVRSIVFTADSRWVVAEPPGSDGRLALIASDVATGDARTSIDVSVPRGKWTPDTDTFLLAVAVGREAHVELIRARTIEVWDLAAGKRVSSRPNSPWIGGKVQSADGALVAFDCPGGVVVLDSATDARRAEVAGESRDVKGNAIPFQSLHVAGIATADGVVVVHRSWTMTKGKGPLTVENYLERTEHFSDLIGVSTKDGRRLWSRDLPGDAYTRDLVVGANTAAVTNDGKISFVNCATGKARGAAPGSKTWTCAAVSPDGVTFWGGATDGSVVLVKAFTAPKSK